MQSLLDHYVDESQTTERLSPDQEVSLAQKWCRDGDPDAFNALAIHVARFVRSTVYKLYSQDTSGIRYDEAMDFGVDAIKSGIELFDKKRDAKLLSYIGNCIRNDFAQLQRDHARCRGMSENTWRFHVACTQHFNRLDHDPTIADKMSFAKYYNENIRKVSLSAVSRGEDQFFESVEHLTQKTDEKGGYEFSSQTYWGDAGMPNSQDVDDLIDQNILEKYLSESISLLDERERFIIKKRWLSEDAWRLGDLAEKFEVSGERIRQIEKGAFKKLQADPNIRDLAFECDHISEEELIPA